MVIVVVMAMHVHSLGRGDCSRPTSAASWSADGLEVGYIKIICFNSDLLFISVYFRVGSVTFHSLNWFDCRWIE